MALQWNLQRVGEQCLRAHAAVLTTSMREQCWALSTGCKCGRACLAVRILHSPDAIHCCVFFCCAETLSHCST